MRHTIPPHDPIIRPATIREELGISNTTFWRWVRAGIIPLKRIGPKVSGIRRSELEAIKAGKAA